MPRKPGDMRTLDDADDSPRIVPGAVLAHGIYAADGWVLRFSAPNRWHRFWAWLLFGARWEHRRITSEMDQ
jgi:hypothetical protein